MALQGVIEMQGTVARYIDELREHGGLKGTDIANITGVSPATVSRWTAGTHGPHPETQLVLSDLYYIVGRLEEFYASKETRLWLFAPHPQLGGKRAIDLITSGETEKVIAILDRLDSEAYL